MDDIVPNLGTMADDMQYLVDDGTLIHRSRMHRIVVRQLYFCPCCYFYTGGHCSVNVAKYDKQDGFVLGVYSNRQCVDGFSDVSGAIWKEGFRCKVKFENSKGRIRCFVGVFLGRILLDSLTVFGMERNNRPIHCHDHGIQRSFFFIHVT
uniref:Uncharacterized protein n=2 Tax=Corethron hystrix TaxID=216773 RepID=A0A7S1BWP6_9STRA|mmetsp:Transcript_41675/g.97551  ORF Transcript_41675/g.97551 Transcript_41675/m.97551 type:complete len:150 (+) Transcript_41675:268-717(+)